MTSRLLWCAALMLATAACDLPCETGDACDRSCPQGATGLCAAHGLCACVADPGLGGDAPAPAADESDSPGDPGARATPDDPGGGVPPAACVAPTPGALVINELMLDGEPAEDAEFVELVNRTDTPLALAGLVLTSNRGANQVQRVAFTGGCIAARGALALFADRSAWIEAPASAWPIEAELRSFGFANGAAFDFRLVGADGAPLDQLVGAGDLIRPGISLNRAPDLVGVTVAPHPSLDAAALAASPGACPNGGRYATGCTPPDGEPVLGGDPAAVGDGAPAVQDVPPAAALGEPDEPPSDDAIDAGPPAHALADPPAPVPDCPAAEPGDLVISEVLVDGRVPRTETDEFVEVVNRTPLPRRLAGVALGPSRAGAFAPRVRFGDGCLPPNGAVIVRPRLEDWAFVPPPAEPITVERADLALGNEARDPLMLVDAVGAELARFPLAGLPIVEGVSLTRYPGLDGDPVLHDRLGPRPTSPGTCPDGRPFGPDDCAAPPLVECRPPVPGELLVDEVLVDGVEAGEADEFVELWNVADGPLSLADIALFTNRGDGLVERLRFESGCLPAGARVALYADPGRWLWSVDPPPVVVDVGRFGFPNDAVFSLELRLADAPIDAVRLPRALIAPGVSAVRSEPVLDAEFVRHDTVSREPSSPGRATGEGVFEAVR